MIYELKVYALPLAEDNHEPTRVIFASSALYPFRPGPILNIIKKDHDAEPILDPEREYVAKTNVHWLSTEVEFKIDSQAGLQASKVSHSWALRSDS